MHDKLECRCKDNLQASVGMLVPVQTIQEMEQSGTWVREDALSNGGPVERGRTGVEVVGAEEESKGCNEDMGFFMRTTKIKDQIMSKMKTHTPRLAGIAELLARGGVVRTPKMDGLTLSCTPRPDVRRWSTFVHRKMNTRVPRETCLRETAKAPIKTGWVETDKGQPGKPNVRAWWVAKEYKTQGQNCTPQKR